MELDGYPPAALDCLRSNNLNGTPQRIRRAFLLLLQAYRYARELNRDIWDFAVEISSLCRQGVTNSDLRWIAWQGYVEHAREITKPSLSGREFRPTGRLTFAEDSCFVLTPAGFEFAQSLRSSPLDPARQDADPGPNGDGLNLPERPEWDCDRRELRFGDRLIKRFRLPSPNQQAILTAFQEEGWPPRIHDPLPPRMDCDPKQRLRDAIKSLNRSQKELLVRFTGDGTGEGILWESIERTQGV